MRSRAGGEMTADNDLTSDGAASLQDRTRDTAAQYYANLSFTRPDEWWQEASYFDRRRLRLEKQAAAHLRLRANDLLLLSDLGLVDGPPPTIDGYLADIDRWRAIISNLGRRGVPQACVALSELWETMRKSDPSQRVELSSESSSLQYDMQPATMVVTHFLDGGRVSRFVCPTLGIDRLYDPDESPQARQLPGLCFALGLPLKPEGDEWGHIPCFEAARLILQGNVQPARDLLLGLSTHTAYLISDVPYPALSLLEEIALTTADANLYVDAVRSQKVDRPLEAERCIRGAARSHGTETFDDAIAAAAAATPRESTEGRSERLGLLDLTPAEADVARWESNRDRRNLHGPLPQCVLRVDAVMRGLTTTSRGPTLVADLPGGGDLSIDIDSSIVDLFGSALDAGTVVSITILLCPTGPDDLDTTASVTGLEPYGGIAGTAAAGAMPAVPSLVAGGRRKDNDFEHLEDTSDCQPQLADLLASRLKMRKEQDYLAPLPPYSPPRDQKARWARVDTADYATWSGRLAQQFPVSVEPRGGIRRQHWLAIAGFSGHLPPDPGPRRQPASGWRSVAEAILGSTWKFELLAGLPGWLLPHLSGDAANYRSLLHLSPSGLTFLTEMALRQEALDDPETILGDEKNPGDALSSRWYTRVLGGRSLAAGIQLEALSCWYHAGFRDPDMAALFSAADLTPEQVIAADPYYVNVGATLGIAGDPNRRPTRAGILWIGTHTAHSLPDFVAAGIPVRTALRALTQGVTVQELEALRDSNSGVWSQMRLGLSPEDMEQFHRAGMTKDQALQFASEARETGDFDLAGPLAWYQAGISPNGRRLWLDAGFDRQTAARWSTVVGPAEAASFKAAGLNLA
jgi:hypothetical protein